LKEWLGVLEIIRCIEEGVREDAVEAVEAV
jgi:hypothetical protein